MIVQRYGVVHISTGDILRDNVKAVMRAIHHTWRN